MEKEQEKSNNKKTEQKLQRNSQRDRNGVIGDLVFGSLLVFLAYQTYEKIFEFSIGQILVYIIGFFCIYLFYGIRKLFF